MARATFVKAARKDIYTYGKQVEAVHEKVGEVKDVCFNL